MARPRVAPPRCVIIAGPNGAGKTTFARQFLPKDAGVVNFELVYRPIVDAWAVWDCSGATPVLLESGP